MNMFGRVITVGVVALAAGCSSGPNPRVAAGESLARETASAMKLIDQQGGYAYDCSDNNGTFETCLAWDGVTKRALDLGQELRLRSENGSLAEPCSLQAAELSGQVLAWYTAAIQWRNTQGVASLTPRSSLGELTRGSDKLSAACTAT
jgi:hypothetical protein